MSVDHDPSDDPLAHALLLALLADPEALRLLSAALAAVGDNAPDARPAAYTVEGLAATIGVSPRVVRNAITRGELQAIKRGGRWLIAPDAIDAWTHDAAPAQEARRRSPQRRRQPLHDALARLERA